MLFLSCPKGDSSPYHRLEVSELLNIVFPGFFKEDLADLKEQINLYENAVRYGVVGLDQSEEWENHLSESCMGLGLKTANKKNGLHGYLVGHVDLYS